MKYTSENDCFQRLIKEYEKHKSLVIGFDFDNTIFDTHNEGFTCNPIINALQRAKEEGFILCLYTAETDPKRLDWKVEYCRFYGIKPDYINQSPLLEGKTIKPFFNLLLDDRAGLYSAFCLLIKILEYVESHRSKSE